MNLPKRPGGEPKSHAPQNNALHLTRRRGVAASRPVVEGRLAGERECSTGLRVSRPVPATAPR